VGFTQTGFACEVGAAVFIGGAFVGSGEVAWVGWRCWDKGGEGFFVDYKKNYNRYGDKEQNYGEPTHFSFILSKRKMQFNDSNPLDDTLRKIFQNPGDTAKNIALLPIETLEGIASPAGLEYLAEITGFQLSLKVLEYSFLRGMVLFKPVLVEMAAEMAAKQGAVMANSAILGAVIERGVADGIASEFYGSVARLATKTMGVVGSVFNYVQIISMFIDTIDPEGYNKMFDAKMMSDYQTFFNEHFMKLYFSSVRSPTKEYTADNLIMNEQNSTADDYKKIALYAQEYLLTLKYNSEGDFITWDAPVAPLKESDFDKWIDKMADSLSNKNVVVGGWIKQHYVVIVIVVIISILIFLFVL
jgi:hypothetical protein